MSKGIPTLLGVAVILLVVILVLTVYNMTMVIHLARGEVVVGTTMQKVLSGGQMPGEEMSAGPGSQARAARAGVASRADRAEPERRPDAQTTRARRDDATDKRLAERQAHRGKGER